MFKTPKSPPPPPPPPAPKVIPTEDSPSVREAQIEQERTGRKRKNRTSTLFDNVLGSGVYGGASTQKNTILG